MKLLNAIFAVFGTIFCATGVAMLTIYCVVPMFHALGPYFSWIVGLCIVVVTFYVVSKNYRSPYSKW